MREEKPRSGTQKRGTSRPPVFSAQARRRHDFATPRLLSEKQVRVLDRTHRKFAQGVSAALSVLARTKVQVDLIEVRQTPYSEFIRSLGSPTSLHLVYCLPEKIPFVLETSPKVLFPIIERMLGGKGEDTVEPARPLTKIEQSLARSIADELLRELQQAWCCGADTVAPAAPVASSSLPTSEGLPGDAQQPEAPRDSASSPGSTSPELQFDIVETEHNPLLMQIVGPAEPAVVLSFQVTLQPPSMAEPSLSQDGETQLPEPRDTASVEAGPLADHLASYIDDYSRAAHPSERRARPTSGSFHICLPTKPFHPTLSRLTRSGGVGMQPDRNSPHERDQILRQLAGTRVQLSAELASVPVALSDLLSLRPGDVIDTQLTTTNEATLLVEGQEVLRGKPATCQGQRAIRVTRYTS